MKNARVLPVYHGTRQFLSWKDLVVAFYTKRCPHQCAFCGLYSRSSSKDVPHHVVKEQIDWLFDHYRPYLSHFQQFSVGNEGSMLDARQFSFESFEYLLDKVRTLLELEVLSIECRPENINAHVLQWLKSRINCSLDVTVGVETHDDVLRNNVWNKGLNRESIENIVPLLGQHGVRMTSYVLAYAHVEQSEEKCKQETLGTIKYLAAICNDASVKLIIYLNPLYIAKHSPLTRIKDFGGFRAPRIQTILEILLESKALGIPIYTGLWSEGLEVGGGDFREYVDYDPEIRNKIKQFNATQDYNIFENIPIQVG